LADYALPEVTLRMCLAEQRFIPPQPPPHESQSAKSSELRFRALLTEGDDGRLELART
jgi:hypothetical protein